MKLDESLKSLIDSKGEDILLSPYLINLLSDYNAFAEIPSSKNVLKFIVDEGIIKNIINSKDPKVSSFNYIHDLYNRYGFRKDISEYVINAIFSNLGYQIINDVSLNNIKEHSNSEHLTIKNIPIDGPLQYICDKFKNLGFRIHQQNYPHCTMIGTFAGIKDCHITFSESEYTGNVYFVSVKSPIEKKSTLLRLRFEILNEWLKLKFGDTKIKSELYASYKTLNNGNITISVTDNSFISLTYRDGLNYEKDYEARMNDL